MSTYYHPVWPELEFGWRVVAGSLVGFMGGAMGSAGGVGGGGIFVPMLTLILAFDPKSSAALSKCMIMGASSSAVYYNLVRARDPALIDYDLGLLIQPMLMLGISFGVAFNVIFPEWIITTLLLLLFIVTSTKAIFKGIETWKKETLMMKQEAAKLGVMDKAQKAAQDKYCVNDEEEDKHPHRLHIQESTELLEPSDEAGNKSKQVLYIGPPTSQEVIIGVLHNTRWKELSILMLVWIAFFAVQIAKIYVAPCSIRYWILNSLQVPVAASATVYEARGLMRGSKKIASGNCKEMMSGVDIFMYCSCGIVAGAIVGLLGLGGGFILAPLFLELGIPPQVASATSTFLMAFSSSMSVVQYYILKRIPVPYATYLAFIAMIAGFTGQHVSRKLTALLGRASIIIFILAATILVSSICLGAAGISHIIQQLENHKYMGFEKLCHQPQI